MNKRIEMRVAVAIQAIGTAEEARHGGLLGRKSVITRDNAVDLLVDLRHWVFADNAEWNELLNEADVFYKADRIMHHRETRQ